MVSQATNGILAGVIAGWLVVVTQPVIKSISNFLKKKIGMPLYATTFLLYLFWLLAMMAIVVKIWG